jgi:hypothetical protein
MRALRLFEIHGIRKLAFRTVAIGESNNDLYLIRQRVSLAEREQKRGAFVYDPESYDARRRCEKDGPLEAAFTNRILAPTTFSMVQNF